MKLECDFLLNSFHPSVAAASHIRDGVDFRYAGCSEKIGVATYRPNLEIGAKIGAFKRSLKREDAKARFSEVVRHVQADGLQTYAA